MGKKTKTAWRIWAKALGEKSGKSDSEADTVAMLRTFIFVTYLITNIAIVANAVRHWNDNDTNSTQTCRDNSRHLAQSISPRQRMETSSKITH